MRAGRAGLKNVKSGDCIDIPNQVCPTRCHRFFVHSSRIRHPQDANIGQPLDMWGCNQGSNQVSAAVALRALAF